MDEIRALRDSVKVSPYNSKYKIYIIDEVHMLSNSAWNALLKTLEEPPKHVVFILATTEINKIPETVMSRCQRFDFSKINDNLMFNHLKKICVNEQIDIVNEALQSIVKLSNGCLRDALSFLDQISKYNCTIDEDLIENNFGILSNVRMEKLYNSIINSDKEDINKNLDKIMNSGITPVNFINDFVNYLLNLIIENNYNSNDEMIFMKEIIYKLNSLLLDFNTIVNLFTLIKVELITLNYFPGNNNVNISQKNQSEIVNENVNIKLDKCNINNNETEDIEKKSIFNNDLKKIRINNAFVNPSKTIKNEFIELWTKFLEQLNIENEYNLLGYVENSKIEVVSDCNVIFSFNSLSEAIVFNQNLEEIESIFNKLNNKSIKFIGLSNEEWLEEKKQYIENKMKKYIYINENIQKNLENTKTKNIAENIFGDDIIEIR